MAGVIVHAGQSPDHRRHPWQGPQIRAETVGPSTPPQGTGKLLQLFLIQLRLATRSACAAQGHHTTPPPLCVPPTDTLATDPQFTRDRRKDHLASSEQASRLLTSLLHSCKVSTRRMRCAHAFRIDDNRRYCHCIMRDSVISDWRTFLTPQYDIFRMKKGEYVWLEATMTLDDAESRVQELGAAEPALLLASQEDLWGAANWRCFQS